MWEQYTVTLQRVSTIYVISAELNMYCTFHLCLVYESDLNLLCCGVFVMAHTEV